LLILLATTTALQFSCSAEEHSKAWCCCFLVIYQLALIYGGELDHGWSGSPVCTAGTYRGVFFFSVGCYSIVKYQFGGEGETGQNVSDSSCSWIIRQIIILR
jgi:hypothetical protein